MTWDEFTAWYGYHVTHYDGIDAWMASAPKRQRDSPNLTGQDEKMRAWYGTLRDADYRLARRATELLAAEPEENQPKGYDSHPRRILAITRRLEEESQRRGPYAGRRTIDGQETFACRLCEDCGYLPVVAAEAVEAMRERGELLDRTRCVACTCRAGARYVERGWTKYDPRIMPRWPDPHQELTDEQLMQAYHADPKALSESGRAYKAAWLRDWLEERGVYVKQLELDAIDVEVVPTDDPLRIQFNP